MAGYIGSKAAVTQADGYTKTEADARYVEGDDTLVVDQTNNRVGIGVSSPSYALDVDGEIRIKTNTNGLIMQNSTSSDVNVLRITGSNNVALRDSTNSDALTIDSSGNLLVGHSSFSFGGANDCVQISGEEGRINIENDTTSTQYVVAFYNPNGLAGKISTNSSSTNYATSSDYRLKENVVDVTDGITRVKQLAPKRFNFIADADTTVDGFLAHEAQTVVPEAVTGTHNEVDADGNAVMQGIDQAKLVPLLTAALQETITKIETLETKVAALEAG